MARYERNGPNPQIWGKAIFIHVPKAAGTSITRLAGVGRTFGHKPFSYYEKWCPEGMSMPMTFSVVRNPYDRYLSAFRYLKTGGGNGMDARWARAHIPQDMDAATFALSHLHKPDIQSWIHFRPQVYFLHNREGEIGVSHVLKFETLTTDWPLFASRHKLPTQLPHENSSKGDKAHLEPEARAAIQNIYANDFAELGYSP